MARSFAYCPTALPEVIRIISASHSDKRGNFAELYRVDSLCKELGIDGFVQENISFSLGNVVRGLHYQVPPYDVGKLVTCVSGEVFDVAVDLRSDSKNYGKWTGVRLDNPTEAMWIPPGFAHGFYALENSVLLYRQTDYYRKTHDRVISWNSPELNINWPLIDKSKGPIISEKDDTALEFSLVASTELDNVVDWKSITIPTDVQSSVNI